MEQDGERLGEEEAIRSGLWMFVTWQWEQRERLSNLAFSPWIFPFQEYQWPPCCQNKRHQIFLTSPIFSVDEIPLIIFHFPKETLLVMTTLSISLSEKALFLIPSEIGTLLFSHKKKITLIDPTSQFQLWVLFIVCSCLLILDFEFLKIMDQTIMLSNVYQNSASWGLFKLILPLLCRCSYQCIAFLLQKFHSTYIVMIKRIPLPFLL